MRDEQAKDFFEKCTGEGASQLIRLAQSGSSRVNWVAEAGHEKYIVTYNENLRENEAFFYFSELFSGLKLNTPQVFYISEQRNLYIQSYLGAKTFSEIIAEEGESERVKTLVKNILKQLFDLQHKTSGRIDYQKTFEYERYDSLPVVHDLYYFKNFMADVLEIQYHKSSLLKEFQVISQKIEALEPKVLMLRDFQARNIIINQNNSFFIDYQAAMEGPAMYDMISFLHQSKANFSESFKEEMTNHFISLYPDNQQEKLIKSIHWIMLMRYLQVLGAYGFRGLIQKKQHFIESIPKAVNNIKNLSESWEEMIYLPELQNVIGQLSQLATLNKIKEISLQK